MVKNFAGRHLSASPAEVAKLLMDNGFLTKSPPKAGTCKCSRRQTPNWNLESQGLSCQWWCSTCCKTLAVTARESREQDQDLFGGRRLALRLLAGALWLYTSSLHLSPDQASVVLDVDHRNVRALFERFNQL